MSSSGNKHDVQDSRKVFKEIEEDYQNHVSNKDDIRWNREHSLENKNSDYDYRFEVTISVVESLLETVLCA